MRRYIEDVDTSLLITVLHQRGPTLDPIVIVLTSSKSHLDFLISACFISKYKTSDARVLVMDMHALLIGINLSEKDQLRCLTL